MNLGMKTQKGQTALRKLAVGWLGNPDPGSRGLWLSVAVAFVGFVCSLFIEQTPRGETQKKASLFFMAVDTIMVPSNAETISIGAMAVFGDCVLAYMTFNQSMFD